MPAIRRGRSPTPSERTSIDQQRASPRVREAARLALIVLGVCVAAAVHRMVAADTLSDTADLALLAGGAIALLAAFCLSLHLVRTGRAAVRLAVPLAVVAISGVFAAESLADLSVAAHDLMSGPDGDAATIALGPGGTDVRFSGEIGEGDAARLAALLAAHPAVTRIHLTSDGGLADEGAALGAVIAAHRLTTYVPDYCVSACTLAFAAGRQRLMLRDARLGFHAPFEEGLFGQLFAGDVSAARAAYLADGIAPGFVDEALAVAPGDLWTPEPQRLLEARVASAVVDDGELPDSNLDGTATLAGARAVVLRNVPILAGLAAVRPVLVDRIAGWYLEAYRHAWSEARVVAGLRALSDGAVALAAAGADDMTLVDLARFVSDAMHDADDDECVAIGARGDLLAAASVLGESDDAAIARASTLIGAAMAHPRAAPASRPQVATASLRIAYRPVAAESCMALRTAYAAALVRPVAEAAMILRPRFNRWARRSVVTLAAAISDP